jgi:Protein kinase domain
LHAKLHGLLLMWPVERCPSQQFLFFALGLASEGATAFVSRPGTHGLQYLLLGLRRRTAVCFSEQCVSTLRDAPARWQAVRIHVASCLYSLEPLSNRFVCRYLVHSLLGCGTFGQVALCTCLETHAEVAVKVIKNQRAYFNQAVIEAQILKLLNQSCDPTGDRHIVRMLDYFLHASHLCIVFERLHANLYDVLRLNGYKGLSLNLVCIIVRQVRSHPRSFFAAITCFLSCHHRA